MSNGSSRDHGSVVTRVPFGSVWGPSDPSLRPFVARSRRVLLFGAAFETIRGVSRKWCCQRGASCDHGSIVPRDPSGSVSSFWGPSNPSLRHSMARSRRPPPIGAAFGTIHGVSRIVVVPKGLSRDHESVVTRDLSGSVTPPGVLHSFL